MTKQEFVEMYDLLYYGHDAELIISGQHYFIEWSNVGIDVFFMENGNGTKIASIVGKNRSDAVAKLFDLKIDGNKNLNDSYDDIEIVDIE